MKKKILIFCMIITVIFSIILIIPEQTKAESTSGWQISYSGSKITATYTITEDDISNGKININCNELAEYLEGLANMGYMTSTATVTFVNNSGEDIQFSDYEFTTENWIKEGDTFTVDTSSTALVNASNYNLGQAWYAMYDFLSEEDDECPVVNVTGFDDNYIRMCMIPNMTFNPATCALFGISAKSTNYLLTTMVTRDDKVKEALSFTNANGVAVSYSADENRTYADYLKLYYDVDSFDELTYSQLSEIFGSEDSIASWKNSITAGSSAGKYLLKSEVENYPLFAWWGFGGKDYTMNGEDAIFNSYYILETDEEVIQLAYEFIYSCMWRFTFDSTVNNISYFDQDYSPFTLMDYIEKNEQTTKAVNEAFKADTVIADGESLVLSNVKNSMYNYDSFSQFREYDYGFSLTFDIIEEEYDVTLQALISGTTTPVAGAKFNVYDDEGNLIAENIETDEEGWLTITGITKGDYTVTSVYVPESYKLESLTAEFTLSDEGEIYYDNEVVGNLVALYVMQSDDDEPEENDPNDTDDEENNTSSEDDDSDEENDGNTDNTDIDEKDDSNTDNTDIEDENDTDETVTITQNEYNESEVVQTEDQIILSVIARINCLCSFDD